MSDFIFEKTIFDDAYLIKPFIAEDSRGFMKKRFEKDIYAKHGIDFDLTENLVSKSSKGVLRGLHFQKNKPQAKIVSVDCGEIYDVIVDIRKKSNTYGKWQGFILSEDNHYSLYIPKGFAHGFLTLSDFAYVNYLCDGKYDKDDSAGIIWNDKHININWSMVGINNNFILSEADKKYKTFLEIEGNI